MQTCTIIPSHPKAWTSVGNFWERVCQKGCIQRQGGAGGKGHHMPDLKLPLSNLPWEDPTPEKGPAGAGGLLPVCTDGRQSDCQRYPGCHLGSREWEQHGSGEGHLIGAAYIGTSRCARGQRGEDRLAEMVQQPLPRASLFGLGQPLALCSLLAPSAKWRWQPCKMLREYEVLGILILFTGIFVPLSVTEACY